MRLTVLATLAVLSFGLVAQAQAPQATATAKAAPQTPDVAAPKLGPDGNVNPGFAKSHENKQINQTIAKLDDGKNVYFLDIGDKFLEEDGSLSKEIMPDFLHLSAEGYQRWADAIAPKLAELMKS